MDFFTSYPQLLVAISGLLAFFLCVNIFPVIIYLSRAKNLMDSPCERSAHIDKTPTMGGIGIFIGFSLALIVCGVLSNFGKIDLMTILSLLGGLIILLFLGIKDDLLVLSPKKKLIGQVFSSLMLVLMTDSRITDLGGLFGIYELPPIVSILLSVLVIVFIINAFNLTDGIDGLAASIGIVASIAFGTFFILNGAQLLSFVSIALIGALLSFLRFNFSKKNKIFMGDSGSMFTGLILAFQGIAVLNLNSAADTLFTLNSSHLIVLAILSYPLLDTIRVFVVRSMQGKSPFEADRNHIHHKLIDSGLSHRRTTAIICYVILITIMTALFVDEFVVNVHYKLLIIITVAPLLYVSAFLIRYSKDLKMPSIPKLTTFL